ncbi:MULTISPECIES: HDOD domain-containing protein [unclassified Colwellia]|uniref:EAL and HDOD domain-containing protein n=1 Tax=unclassified Colwellia TaxID=196834 RepID=UPI00286FFC03|nr:MULTISPECIES: HDOD domain-containing protein [unclassified Colwellia]
MKVLFSTFRINQTTLIISCRDYEENDIEIYTARQPILNRKKKVVAYELLFRDSQKNCFPTDVTPDIATAKLLINSYLSIGLDEMTEGKPALINFPMAMLSDHLVNLAPYKNIIVEILETVEPSDENFDVLAKLFHQGYTLALDDFIYSTAWDRFLPFIKLIKIDIVETPLSSIAHLLPHFREYKIKLLAEKVETHEEFMQAKELGFEYFQGYFFYKPEILIGVEIESSHPFLMSIYHEVMKNGYSYRKLEGYFEHDMDLTYKLLRFVNSVFFGHTHEIKSIKQAIAYLGEVQLRKFICLIVMVELNPQKPTVLIQNTILRARLCEQFAKIMGLKQLTKYAFLTGLFSTLDAILDRPMEKILSSMPLAEEINIALIEQTGSLAECLAFVVAYTEGDWDTINIFIDIYDIDPANLISTCNKAYQWLSAYKIS